MLFPGTELFLLVDQLLCATACTIAAARIEAEAGGLAGEGFLLFSVHGLWRALCVSVGSVFSCSFVHPSGNERPCGFNNTTLLCRRRPRFNFTYQQCTVGKSTVLHVLGLVE